MIQYLFYVQQVTDKPEASSSGVMETEQITSKSRAGCTPF